MVRCAGAALVAGGLALGCGDVPTLQDGVAYISAIELPLPAVAAGDTLRDSLGRVAPLRVRAFGRDSQEITGLEVSFLPTVLPAGVTIDANGVLVARDTVGSVQIVGRVGNRLQTTIAILQIVPDPTTIARPAGDLAGDTSLALPALRPIPVTVTGVYRGASTTVNGIIVRYRIDSLRPRSLPSGSAILANAAGAALRPDSTIAVDTTKSGGTATRSVLIRAGSGVQSVFVSASARRLRDGTPLAGSPVRVEVSVKP
ncbi:MAG: hypothetical protein LH467_04105 [Gemmatimonadaceae bacterium]|nr:hypothetical protein [Gemmatimonadaceae bacterium]